MIINDPSILKEMMEDMKKAPEIYKPGNFWMFYVEKIARELEKKDLNQFRNWICGPGSILSFGGGRDLHGMKYGSNVHPFSDAFKKFDKSFAPRDPKAPIRVSAEVLSWNKDTGFGFIRK